MFHRESLFIDFKFDDASGNKQIAGKLKFIFFKQYLVSQNSEICGVKNFYNSIFNKHCHYFEFTVKSVLSGHPRPSGNFSVHLRYVIPYNNSFLSEKIAEISWGHQTC